MHRVQINNDVYNIPACWDELTVQELHYLAKLTKEDIPVERLKLFMLLYHLKGHVSRHRLLYGDKFKIVIGKEPEKVTFRIKRRKYLLTPDEMNQLADLFQFLLTTKREYGIGEKTDIMGRRYSQMTFINPEILENPYPSFRLHLKKITGPEACLYDLKFEQFMFLSTYLEKMSKDTQYINHVLACLWHSNKTWDAHRIDKDAKLLSHLPDVTKMVMYWFISSSMEYWAQCYPRIFSGESSSQGKVFDNQQRLLNTLANGDITKKNEVREANIVDAFYTMDESLRQSEEMEKKISKQ